MGKITIAGGDDLAITPFPSSPLRVVQSVLRLALARCRAPCFHVPKEIIT
jgi:hypothetical protein